MTWSAFVFVDAATGATAGAGAGGGGDAGAAAAGLAAFVEAAFVLATGATGKVTVSDHSSIIHSETLPARSMTANVLRSLVVLPHSRGARSPRSMVFALSGFHWSTHG